MQGSSTARHDWVWFGLPPALLAHLFIVVREGRSSGLFGGFSPEWLGMGVATTISVTLLVLAAQWLMRLGPVTGATRRPALEAVPALAGGLLGWVAMPTPTALTPAGTVQWCFLIGLGAILMASLARVGLPQQPTLRGVRDDYKQLTKPGLNALVLVTAAAGFVLGSFDPTTPRLAGFDPWLFLRAMAGTWLTAAGASTLNQFIERRLDAAMTRTANRPLPASRMDPVYALWFGVALSLAGMALLALTVNLPAAYLAAITHAVYLFLYTPLKRINSLSTLAGAISGALPPVIGWVAATGGLAPMAAVLFGILFFWQIPHFLAIAWKYRDQYREAGMPMYSVLDPRGRATGVQMSLYASVLLPIGLMPLAAGIIGWAYGAVALALGGWFMWLGIRFALDPVVARSRRVFFASIAYLPLLLAAMMLDRFLI